MKKFVLLSLVSLFSFSSAYASTTKENVLNSLGYFVEQMEMAITYHDNKDYEFEMSDIGWNCFHFGQDKNQLREILSDANFVVVENKISDETSEGIKSYKPSFCQINPTEITHKKVQAEYATLIELAEQLASEIK